LQKRIDDPLSEIAFSIVLPFALFTLAEKLHVSAVLAVVTAGLVRGWPSPQLFSALTRLPAVTVLGVIGFLAQTVVFILIGLMLPEVMKGLAQYSWATLLLYGAAVSGAVIVLRFAVIFGAAYVPRLSARWRRNNGPPPADQLTVVAWSGMRGAVSLVIALA